MADTSTTQSASLSGDLNPRRWVALTVIGAGVSSWGPPSPAAAPRCTPISTLSRGPAVSGSALARRAVVPGNEDVLLLARRDGTDKAAQLEDVGLHGGERAARRSLAPDLLDEGRHGNDHPRAQGEQRENLAWLGRRRHNGYAVPWGIERPEDLDL